MRFKIDENLPVEVADQLQQANYDALTVYDQELVGAVDENIAEVCLDEKRVLVTLDLDFSRYSSLPSRKISWHHRDEVETTRQALCPQHHISLDKSIDD